MLRAYVLYPYLQAQRWITALRTAPGAETDRGIASFIAATPDLPVLRELRRDWLLNLAERQDWATFLEHDIADTETPALVCQQYRARIESGRADAEFARALQAFWRDAPQMPQACVPPFDWLKAQGLLIPEVIELRARKALADGNVELAEWLTRMLPSEPAALLQQWARLLRDPGRELEAIAARKDSGVEWVALRDGFARLARRDTDRAVNILQRLDRKRLDTAQHAELQRLATLGLAWDRRAEALDGFERLPPAAIDDAVHEWRVRAALWNGRMQLAAGWLHELPPGMAAEPRWSYWRARSLEILGRGRQSQPIYETLSQDNGYYGLLAAWRLGRAHQPRERRFDEDLIIQSELLEIPALIRARELHFAGLAHWAHLEWRAATRDLDPGRRLQAARLAADWGWHVQAVSMLSDVGALDVLELSYPDAFLQPIRTNAQALGLPPDWIYGLMRQESLFNPQAVSPSNAYGLLQLLLPTAREVARRRGDPLPGSTDLLRPEVNIPLGATYLSQMHQRFGGQFVPAVAAYNAGPNAVARWLPAQPMEADFWIENIPFNETRRYVQRVLWHITAHGWRRTGEPQDPAPLLQPVRGPEQ